jgi:signal recognition particle GTPase
MGSATATKIGRWMRHLEIGVLAFILNFPDTFRPAARTQIQTAPQPVRRRNFGNDRQRRLDFASV